MDGEAAAIGELVGEAVAAAATGSLTGVACAMGVGAGVAGGVGEGVGVGVGEGVGVEVGGGSWEPDCASAGWTGGVGDGETRIAGRSSGGLLSVEETGVGEGVGSVDRETTGAGLPFSGFADGEALGVG